MHHHTSFVPETLPNQSATNAIEFKRKDSKINEPDRYSAAHNGLVAGSSPAAPTDEASNQPSFSVIADQKRPCFVTRRGISAIANAARAPIDAPPLDLSLGANCS
jgi:hypothetical protein